MESANSNKPQFSIIIPTYNTTVVLEQCIEALCQQSVEKDCFEVIIINDGGDAAVYQDIQSKERGINIRYYHQDHKGPAAARNLGIEKAQGNIILLLDDDSLPTRNWLDATIKAWDKYPDFDGIGGYVISEPTDSIYCRLITDFFNWYLEQSSLNKESPFLITCNAGYKKDSLNKVHKFDEWFKKAAGEDRDLNIKLSRAGGRLRLDRDILVYHDRDLSFLSFVRKNYNYGKAAYNIYLRYPELKRLSKNSYVALYVSILKRYSTFREKFMVFSLLTLSQISTILGYYAARRDR